jgi:putative ABC transport system permease protein
MLPGFPPAHVPLWAITLSVGFSAAVGIVFGILPAAKAAQLDPIESLRYE